MLFSSKIGFGGKIKGLGVIVKEGAKTSEFGTELSGKILLFIGSPSKEVLEKASFVGAVGIVVPEIHWRDFEYFRTQGDFVMMVVQRFGCDPMQSEVKEKIGKLDGKQLELDGDKHEIKAV